MISQLVMDLILVMFAVVVLVSLALGLLGAAGIGIKAGFNKLLKYAKEEKEREENGNN